MLLPREFPKADFEVGTRVELGGEGFCTLGGITGGLSSFLGRAGNISDTSRSGSLIRPSIRL